MLTFLLATIALTPAYSAVDPLDCPENQGRFSLLAPLRSTDNVPINASVWFTENPSLAGASPTLVEVGPDSEVAVDLIRTVADRFTLVEMRPTAPLDPNNRYELRNPSQTLEPMVRFTTGAAVDNQAPPEPSNVRGFGGLDACTGFGLRVTVALSDEPDPILLALDPDTDDLMSFGARNNVHINAAEGSDVVYALIAMDLAGNRSAPKTHDGSATLNDGFAGCTCVPAKPLSGLLALPMLWLVLSRARCRGSSSPAKRSRSRRATR